MKKYIVLIYLLGLIDLKAEMLKIGNNIILDNDRVKIVRAYELKNNICTVRYEYKNWTGTQWDICITQSCKDLYEDIKIFNKENKQ